MSDQINNSESRREKKSLLNRLAAGFARSGQLVLDWINQDQFHDYVYRVILQRIGKLPPRERLNVLLRLDDALYHLQSQAAIDYDNGVHTKVRHTRYPEFFLQRIEKQVDVLDVGCGFGAVAHEIAVKTGARVVGIDIVNQKIDTARQMYQLPNLEFRVGDVLTLETQQQYDVIVLSNVLEHLSGRVAFLSRLQEITSAVRFLIRVPVLERDWRVPLKQELGLEWRLDPTHETEYTLESFREEMDMAGLKITHLEVRWGEIWSELVPDGS